MGFYTVEDLTGTMDMIVFPKAFSTTEASLTDNHAVVVKGTVNLKEETVSIIADELYDVGSEDAEHILRAKVNPKYGLYIKVPSQNDVKFRNACAVLDRYNGKKPVYFYIEDKKQYIKAPEKYFVRNSINIKSELEYYVGKGNVAFIE